MYDFLKGVIPTVNAFPRDQRHILGARLENLCIETLELLIEAYYLPKDQKKANLIQANLNFEKTRYLIRLGYELGYYNSTRYGRFAEQLLELGRMTGGWLKSLEK